MRNKALMGLALVIGLGGGIAASRLLHPGRADAAACTSPSASTSYNVMIMNGKPSPDTISAKLCDTLTIMNMDKQAREIAFGPHENHVPYDGIAEKALKSGDSLTITLNQTGSFRYHDHLNDEVVGYFNVTKN